MAQPIASTPPAGQEGLVTLPVDGAGKSVRAFPVTAYVQQADGTFAATTVYMQALVIGGADGSIVAVDRIDGANVFRVHDHITSRAIEELTETVGELVTALRDKE
jgi:hypothetical protein